MQERRSGSAGEGAGLGYRGSPAVSGRAMRLGDSLAKVVVELGTQLPANNAGQTHQACAEQSESARLRNRCNGIAAYRGSDGYGS
jgi:hypothetical protein